MKLLLTLILTVAFFDSSARAREFNPLTDYVEETADEPELVEKEDEDLT